MKQLLYITTFLVTTLLTAQQNPFVGTWEYDNGTEVFRVILGENNEGRIRGDYELIEKSTGIVIYQSRKVYPYGVVEHSIYGGNDSNTLTAFIDDRTVNHPGYHVLRGRLKMELLHTSPYQTATWKVKRTLGIILSDDYREFNIPTDIVLTKVDNNPIIED